MIRYDLKCGQGHDFDSWFASSQAFDKLSSAGALSCPLCGDARISKAMMAPALRAPRDKEAGLARQTPAEDAPSAAPLPACPPAQAPGPNSEALRAQVLAEFKRAIEARSEYVGLSFAAEARRIHAGEVPERMIHGEAHVDEARALVDEGVPIAPLPFIPTRRTS